MRLPHALAAALKTSAEAENSCRDTTKKEMGLLPCATRMLSLVLEPELVQSWMGGGGVWRRQSGEGGVWTHVP